MTTQPFFSIITPSYNQGQYIEAMIRSILMQDYPNFEHIIIDGGSTDGTLDILKRYEGRYRMRWISEPDAGQAHGIEKGVQMCQGDIVSWLNTDDLYLSLSVLSQVAACFKRYPDAHVVCGGGVELASDGAWMRQIKIWSEYVVFQRLRWNDHILQPATFIKKEALSSVRFNVSLHYAFDWDLFIQLSKRYNFLVVNEPWAGYRLWRHNKTEAGGSKRIGEMMRIIKRYIGPWSFQYAALACYYAMFRMTELTPRSWQYRLKQLIRSISVKFRILSFHRLTSV
jgi:glycosyltransferase involved in cell wall biosynthesis